MKSLGRRTQPDLESTPRRDKPRRHRVKPLSPVVRRGFGRTGGGSGSSGGSGGSGGAPPDAVDVVDSGGKGGRRSGDGRVIKIVSNDDHSVQVGV